MNDTQELLANFVRNGSESAFRELVTRYFDLVYSTAVRLVDGDTHRAEDVSQIVFADLARMACKLSEGTMLGGWLHRHTCLVARTVMRGERRRQVDPEDQGPKSREKTADQQQGPDDFGKHGQRQARRVSYPERVGEPRGHIAETFELRHAMIDQYRQSQPQPQD